MGLWTEWFKAVAHLRPACTRWRTYAWMVLVLAGAQHSHRSGGRHQLRARARLGAGRLPAPAPPLAQPRPSGSTGSPRSGRAGVADAFPACTRRGRPRLPRRRPQGPQGGPQDAGGQEAPPGVREQLQAPVHLRPQLPVRVAPHPHGARATRRPCRSPLASAKASSGPIATGARSSITSSSSFSR